MNLKYILKKILYGLLVVFSVTVLLSSIIFLAPIDPARLTFGQRTDQKTLEFKRNQLGLNQPLYVQLCSYLNDISPISVHTSTDLDKLPYSKFVLFQAAKISVVLKFPYLRNSFQTGESVTTMIASAFPKTLILSLFAIFIAIILGVSLGVISAVHQNTVIDFFINTLSVIGYSLPTYVAAMLLALFFGYYFSHVTNLNLQGSIFEYDDFGNEIIVWKNLILPTIALGLRPVAIISQLTRSIVIENLSQNYIKTAKAKGLRSSIVLFRHALRNAINPLITSISGWMASLLAGAFFVESVFNFKGIGDLTVNALLNFDLPVVLGAIIFTSLIFVIINILSDLLNTYLDPRLELV